MPEEKRLLNQFLVETFHAILRTEERCIAETGHVGLSVKEANLVAAVCYCTDHEKNSSREVASLLGVTPGTLTTAAIALEKKGYLIRRRCEKDKRIVRLCPTALGRQADAAHSRFHSELIDAILCEMPQEEVTAFLHAIVRINAFFREKNDVNND